MVLRTASEGRGSGTRLHTRLFLLVSGEGGVDGGIHVAPEEGVEEEREQRRGRVPARKGFGERQSLLQGDIKQKLQGHLAHKKTPRPP